MTPEQLHIIQHALGCDKYGLGEQYRNHYCGGAEECRPLVEMGYMTEHKASEITGGDPLFTVTKAGIAAMKEASPKPPKITRSQQRMIDYRQFADAFDCTFKDFLRIQKTDWYKDMKAGKPLPSIFEGM
jgi:hypothetical protein